MKICYVLAINLLLLLPSGSFAQKGLMQFTSTSPEAKKLMREAWTALSDARIEDAKELIQKAKEKDPSFAMAYLFTFYEEGELFKQNVTKASTLKSSADEKLLINAQLASFEKKPTAEYYEALIKKYPKDDFLHLISAMNIKGAADDKRALQILESLVQRSPGYAPGYNILGYQYMDMGEMDKARESFDKYISLRPEVANVYDSKGDYFMREGKLAEAADMFDKSAGMDPKNMAFSKVKADRARNKMRENEIANEVKPVWKELVSSVEKADVGKLIGYYRYSDDFVCLENGKQLTYKEWETGTKEFFGSVTGNKLMGKEIFTVINENFVTVSYAGTFESRMKDGTVNTLDNFAISLGFEKVKDKWLIVHSHQSYVSK